MTATISEEALLKALNAVPQLVALTVCAAMASAAPAGAEPAEAAVAEPAVVACAEFAAALDHAALYYSDFADAISGDQWSYSDPTVTMTNEDGRTALRQSAAAALSASRTPGLAPEIADPMRSWSMSATKLLLLMGLHGSGDSMNAAATAVNERASAAQFACAEAGTHA